jgi:hypothetical protein
MKKQELLNFSMSGYNLAAIFCQSNYFGERVCILPRKDIVYKEIDLKNHVETKSLTYVQSN